MTDLKEQLAKDYGKTGKPQLPSKLAEQVSAKANGEQPKTKSKPPVRKIYTTEQRAELQLANLRRSAAIAARRIMALVKSSLTSKLDAEKVITPLRTALLVSARLGNFSDKYEKTGRAIVKFLNRDSEKTGLRFGIAENKSIKCGRVQIQFED